MHYHIVLLYIILIKNQGNSCNLLQQMLNYYIGTGYYIDDCGNGLQQPITGQFLFTGFLDQQDSDNKAYCGAIQNAFYLRSLNPCLSDSTGILTTTTTSSSTTLPPDFVYTGGISYDWTGDFNPEPNEYYDIAYWGRTNGYISGYKFNTNQYFSQVAMGDLNSNGVVLAVVKGSGLVIGTGDNSLNQLDIPANLTGIKQVSIGYDHCLALTNTGTVISWGKDNWGVSSFGSSLTNVIKVCAGIGGSVFLLSGGIITGTNTINGGTSINYQTNYGYLDIDHYSNHILAITSNGTLTGIGTNLFGECNNHLFTGIKNISAGKSTSFC